LLRVSQATSSLIMALSSIAQTRGGSRSRSRSRSPCGGSAPAGNGGVILLDGGMGHQLKAMGIEIKGPVGSMRRFLGVCMANLDDPEKVRDAHLAYIDAGAEVVTTNSYACVPKCLSHFSDADLRSKLDGGAGGGRLEQLVTAAGRIAREACDMRPLRKVKVAGCLPPLAESYQPDRVGSFDDNLKQYRMIAAYLKPFSDVLICETMSTADEARAAFTAASETGLPVWVSWTLDESRPVLRSGESLEQAMAALLAVPGCAGALGACLFNCTSPEITTEAMPMLRAIAPPGVRVGGYANGFVTAGGGEGEYRDLGADEYYKDFVAEWISGGAEIVGGCCGVFPKHIEAVRAALDAASA